MGSSLTRLMYLLGRFNKMNNVVIERNCLKPKAMAVNMSLAM